MKMIFNDVRVKPGTIIRHRHATITVQSHQVTTSDFPTSRLPRDMFLFVHLASPNLNKETLTSFHGHGLLSMFKTQSQDWQNWHPSSLVELDNN